MVDHVLVGVNGAEDGSLVDADLDGRFGYVFGDEEDESYFIDAGLADQDCATVVIEFGELQVVWRSVHGLSCPLYMLTHLNPCPCLIKCTFLKRLLRSAMLHAHTRFILLKSSDPLLITHCICERSCPYPLAKAVQRA